MKESLLANPLGIYEKALPASYSWQRKLEAVADLGFDFLEISIDETDERLARLFWSHNEQRELRDALWNTGIPIASMCFSGHRRFPMGSRNPETRARSVELMQHAIRFAVNFGIRVIQLAGYDVYYEESGPDTHAYFVDNLRKAAMLASKSQVMLAIEIMDTVNINSIAKYLWYDKTIHSPWLAVYPDIGNLAAWGNDVCHELAMGFDHIVGIHLKDTLAVTQGFPGKFREVPFGEGCVDFAGAFRTLNREGYEGPFLIEMWTSSAADALQQIANAREFIVDQMRIAESKS
jgi:hexulose-6-phosphate isomerase